MNNIEKIGYLKQSIDEQREWGNNNVADLFAEELNDLLRELNKEIGA